MKYSASWDSIQRATRYLARTSSSASFIPKIGDLQYKVTIKPSGRVSFMISNVVSSVRFVQSLGEPIGNGEGTVVRLAGALLDITERRQTEEALREAQAELAHV